MTKVKAFDRLFASHSRLMSAVGLTALSLMVGIESTVYAAEAQAISPATSASTGYLPAPFSSFTRPDQSKTELTKSTQVKAPDAKSTNSKPAADPKSPSTTKTADTKPALSSLQLAPPMKPKVDTSESFSSNPKKSPGSGADGSGTANGVNSNASASSNKHLPPPAAPGSAPAISTAGTGADENYPVIATLETAVLGASEPGQPVESRLAKLENTVFRQTFPTQSLFDRTERLKSTLLGVNQPFDPNPDTALNQSQMIEAGGTQMQNYYDELSQKRENQSEVSNEEASKYFVELINAERQKFGYGALTIDEIGSNVARAQIEELSKRGLITHQDLRGNNPDRRYTMAGGSDLMFESLVSMKVDSPDSRKLNKANVAQLVKTVFQRQDERDALLSTDATGIGFAMSLDVDKDRFMACCDVITHHGVNQPIPYECRVGDKIEVKGVVLEPYKFERISLAWEAKSNLATVADESEEALPYFAPLDYGAFAKNSDKDYSTSLGTLRTIGIIACIAGGVFMPPVALAAPMIAMSGGMGSGEPKPVSDIPIKGGVHVDGNYFSGKIPINHEAKDGLYYVTVWATITKYGKPIPISRRAVLAVAAQEPISESVSAKQISDAQSQSIKKHKHKKNNAQSQNAPTSQNVQNPQNASGI